MRKKWDVHFRGMSGVFYRRNLICREARETLEGPTHENGASEWPLHHQEYTQYSNIVFHFENRNFFKKKFHHQTHS